MGERALHDRNLSKNVDPVLTVCSFGRDIGDIQGIVENFRQVMGHEGPDLPIEVHRVVTFLRERV